MMYYTLGIALCLAVMFLVYSAALLLSIPTVALGRKALRTARPQTQANVMFFLRLAPLLLALNVSLGLALPAFLRFEPHATGEVISPAVLMMAALGGAVLAVIALRVARMLHATSRLEQRWIRDARRMELPGVDVPVYQVSGCKSLLAVTGVFRPQVFVSCDVAQALTQEELTAALDHELAHVRRFDNLRQLLLKSMRLPIAALAAADADWTSASEIAADEAAVRAGASVLELCSALIKVGRLRGAPVVQVQLAASHLAPAGCGVSTGERAAHLRILLENEPLFAASSGGARKLLAGLALVAAYFACLATLLPAVHEALELLVR
jgi:Zn-dependent protease with chaperone function